MVATGFKTKQVNTLTLGERMKEARRAAGLRLEKLSSLTKIPRRYLKYLEEDDYDALPAEVYVKGFLRQCAYYFNMNPQQLFDLYMKELNIRNNIKKSLFGFADGRAGQRKIFSRNYRNSFSRPRFVITPKLILAVVTAAVLALVGFYFWYQIHAFISGPAITIVEPDSNKVVSEEKITLRGKTDSQSTVKINGTVVSLSSQGTFSETLNLNRGNNIIKIVATNRQGKSSEVTRQIFVQGDH